MNRKPRVIAIGLFLAIPVIASVVMIVVARGVATAKQRANSANCANSIVAIGCGLRLWVDDNGGKLPKGFILASNELVWPGILVCPTDRKSTPAPKWENFTGNNSSYELGSPDSDLSNPDTIILRCRIHNHVGYADGTVFDGVKRRTKQP